MWVGSDSSPDVGNAKSMLHVPSSELLTANSKRSGKVKRWGVTGT
jgi:hypothetical protein